ncbi:P-loop containing nucleoside triphosphate hydrolase protein [Cylindrobasidium torrendii FP15055 ss-10]|uniref:p-loop containing nucleoside triphosphate hydrolase protein n=1 Tax=Cylindrobasidium torrendii FP15055 ss-10 TaxID=1314674 RepID=A0A0D7B6K1_9AGAR|nr:P-loop containing nucleoside triphosphate hydrolase protein [Cylindrobasidium torrendii FP15055 ss-10]
MKLQDDNANPSVEEDVIAPSTVRSVQLGLFKVLYDDAPFAPLDPLKKASKCLGSGWRLLSDVVAVATIPAILFLLGSLWLVFADAVSSVVLYMGLQMLPRVMGEPDYAATSGTVLLIVWLFSSAITSVAARIHYSQRAAMDSLLKAYFYPQYARASLSLDLKAACSPNPMPEPTEYRTGVAESGRLFLQLEHSLRFRLSIYLQVIAQAMLLRYSGFHSFWTAGIFGIVFPVAMLCLPSTYFRGSGFLFFPTDEHYLKADAYHQLIFAPWRYRESMIKTGGFKNVVDEYTKELKSVGSVKYSEIYIAMAYLPLRGMFWEFIHVCVMLSPTLYALYLSKFPAVNTLWPSLLAVQILYVRFSSEIKKLQASILSPISTTLMEIKDLYDDKFMKPTMDNGVTPIQGRGMSVSLKNVCYKDPTSQKALENITFELPSGQPGNIAVVTGTNSSGKSTLLNMIPRLFDPDSGVVAVNGVDVKELDWDSLRQKIAFLSQTDVLYPLSYADNILAGVDLTNMRDQDIQEHLQLAVRLAGAQDIIDRMPNGFDEKYTPDDFRDGLRMSSHVGPSRAVVAAEERECPPRRPTRLSTGELERLLLARMFAKILSPNMERGLMLVDEGLSSLDAQTMERVSKAMLDIVATGSSMIVVSGGQSPFMKLASTILYMDKGRVVEQGAHAELMDLGGVYADMH